MICNHCFVGNSISLRSMRKKVIDLTNLKDLGLLVSLKAFVAEMKNYISIFALLYFLKCLGWPFLKVFAAHRHSHHPTTSLADSTCFS